MTSDTEIKKAARLLNQAVNLLNQGELVGMPTETVYGLAGKISSQSALKNIFACKQRPLFDPLIVHVADVDSARNLSSEWLEVCDILAEKFWPGPLTIVVKKNKVLVDDLITAGLESVGIRFPSHPVARDLIQAVGEPLAAPSANLFSRTSPSMAEHVRKNFPDLFVLDGGKANIGIESTVIRVGEEGGCSKVSILRKGIITRSGIKSLLESKGIETEITFGEGKSASPGQEETHYRMDSKLFILKEGESLSGTSSSIELRFSSKDPLLVARELYSRMHKISQEAGGKSVVFYVKEYMKGEVWEALLDRLHRAAERSPSY